MKQINFYRVSALEIIVSYLLFLNQSIFYFNMLEIKFRIIVCQLDLVIRYEKFLSMYTLLIIIIFVTSKTCLFMSKINSLILVTVFLSVCSIYDKPLSHSWLYKTTCCREMFILIGVMNWLLSYVVYTYIV